MTDLNTIHPVLEPTSIVGEDIVNLVFIDPGIFFVPYEPFVP